MSPKVTELAQLLIHLEGLCGRMIELTEEEREALIGQDIERMNLVAGAKNALSASIAKSRDQARLLTAELAPQGLEAKTVARLMDLLPEEARKTLAAPYKAYKIRAGEVELHNTHNMILARQGLRAIEGRVSEMVSAIQGAKSTYHRPGQAGQPVQTRLGRVHRRA